MPKLNKPLIEYVNERLIQGAGGCMEWTGHTCTSGYGIVGRRGKLCRVHRVVWEVLRGPIPGGLCVCHACDNRRCANVEHLFLGTNADNVADKVRKGRQHRPIGTRNPKARLTHDQVRTIRADSRVQQVIADEYGIQQTLVSKIKRGELWSHVA